MSVGWSKWYIECSRKPFIRFPSPGPPPHPFKIHTLTILYVYDLNRSPLCILRDHGASRVEPQTRSFTHCHWNNAARLVQRIFLKTLPFPLSDVWVTRGLFWVRSSSVGALPCRDASSSVLLHDGRVSSRTSPGLWLSKYRDRGFKWTEGGPGGADAVAWCHILDRNL